MEEITTFEVTNLFDVWGNKKDGWEVNDQRPAGLIVCRWTEDSILKAMKKAGLIKKTVRKNSVKWDDSCDGIGINEKSGKPVFFLSVKQ
jgi:hypothetical protein